MGEAEDSGLMARGDVVGVAWRRDGLDGTTHWPGPCIHIQNPN